MGNKYLLRTEDITRVQYVLRLIVYEFIKVKLEGKEALRQFNFQRVVYKL